MPLVSERGFLHEYANVPGVGRDIQVATTGVKIDHAAITVEAPPPVLGAHNEEIWGSLGIDKDAPEKLKKNAVI